MPAPWPQAAEDRIRPVSSLITRAWLNPQGRSEIPVTFYLPGWPKAGATSRQREGEGQRAVVPARRVLGPESEQLLDQRRALSVSPFSVLTSDQTLM